MNQRGRPVKTFGIDELLYDILLHLDFTPTSPSDIVKQINSEGGSVFMQSPVHYNNVKNKLEDGQAKGWIKAWRTNDYAITEKGIAKALSDGLLVLTRLLASMIEEGEWQIEDPTSKSTSVDFSEIDWVYRKIKRTSKLINSRPRILASEEKVRLESRRQLEIFWKKAKFLLPISRRPRT